MGLADGLGRDEGHKRKIMDAWLLAGAPEWMAALFPEIGQKQIWGEKNSNSRVEISHCLWSPQKFSVFYSMYSICIGLRSLIRMKLYPEKLPGNTVCCLVLSERSIMTHEVPPPATHTTIFHKAVIHNSGRMLSAQQPCKNERDTCMKCWAMFPLQKLY